MRTDPELMDREDDRDFKARREAARKRAHLTAIEPAEEPKSRKERRECYFRFKPTVLGLSSPAAVADMIRRNIIARETAIALRDPGICHVRNGKPLTEHGAKMLGVEWKAE